MTTRSGPGWTLTETHAPKTKYVDRGLADVPCENCQSTEDVRWESSRTLYHTEPLTIWERILDNWVDPNRNQALCRPCAEEHHEYWDDMWNEYYASCR